MSHLSVALLGTFHVTRDGSPVDGFDTDKTRALLAYTCVEALHAHRRDALAGLLWPEQSDETARKNLRHALYKLRPLLGDEEESPGSAQDKLSSFLLITPQSVQFNPASDYRLDVEAFTGLIEACRTHRHRRVEQCSTCHARLKQAAELYRGDFLAGFFLQDSQAFEEWLVLKREGLRREAVEVFSRLSTYYETRAKYEPTHYSAGSGQSSEQALQYSYRQLELEPWREEAHRQVMRLLALSGQRNAALAQYESCRQALLKELGVEPDRETTELYKRIKAGDSAILDIGFTGPGTPGRISESDPDQSKSKIPPQAGPVNPISKIPRHNLPAQVTPFIGREEELARITERLDSLDYRLLTLLGPGGVGKTRLALQAAFEQVGTFVDGVFWVPLASVNSPGLLASSIAQSIEFHFQASEDPQVQLLNYLRDKEMLLVLDNFEHLLDGGAQLLASILKSAPRISLMVTSRERLGLQAEFLLDLSGLPFPEADDGRWTMGGAHGAPPIVHRPSSAALASYGAVQLFVERAQQAHSDFMLTRDTAQGVLEICRIVAGLPLGIVLAAAWTRHLPVDRIARSIRANLDFLTSAARDASPQHSSLRAVFNHSWNLLSEEEQRVFRGLSVFRGGWDEDAAEAVIRASLHHLLSLVDKSLLRRNLSGRFGMHELLRQYATEKLEDMPEERDELKRRHAHYYLDLAELAEEGLRGADQGEWLEGLEREHDNLRAALQWAGDAADVEVGLRLGGALSGFWFVRGYYSEGREALASILKSWAEKDPTLIPGTELMRIQAFRAKALRAAGDLDRAQGDYESAQSRCEESLAIFRQLDDKANINSTLVRLAIVAWDQGDLNLARTLHEEALLISRELGDKKGIAIALGNLGLFAFEEGDYAAARSQLEESIALERDLGRKFLLAIRLNNLGNVALMQGDYTNARALHEEGMAMRREAGDRWGVAISLIGLGGVVVAAGDAEKGTRLLGAANALLDAVGALLESDDRIPYEYAMNAARSHLDEEAFETAWAEGRVMSMEQAIEYALEG